MNVDVTASKPFDVTITVDDTTKLWLAMLVIVAAGVAVYLKK